MNERASMLLLVLALSTLPLGCGGKTSDDDLEPDGSGGATSASGAGASSGDAGSGGSALLPDNLSLLGQVDRIDSIDLLFVLDNSKSMAAKQSFLADAIPALTHSLISPDCVGPSGQTSPGPVESGSAESDCEPGYSRRFQPVSDIHVAVITASLGGHGGSVCSEGHEDFLPEQNDKGWLLPTVRQGLDSWEDLGFLAWDPGAVKSPAGEAEEASLLEALAEQVNAVGQSGCGFESTLEAWYRFLVDPEPPVSVSVDMATSEAQATGVDEVLIEQRRQFLRPDSLLVIVMVSDENDCSILDGGLGWMVAEAGDFHMPPATSACEVDPNDPCCRSCGLSETEPPAGCDSIEADPSCASESLAADRDPQSLRCYRQKQRFGVDLLYPTSRYVRGLTQPLIEDRGGELVTNPVYEPYDLAGRSRFSSSVLLVGIVGVPWQDIATEQSLEPDAPLEYLLATDLETMGRWPLILGEDGGEPGDPFMRESTQPRDGKNPLTDTPITVPGTWNEINGHDYVPNVIATDLQYACIFPLEAPRACVDEAGENVENCDCGLDDLSLQKPICQSGPDALPDTTQYFAPAYPSLRQLEVLRDLEGQAVVGSICPKVSTGDVRDPSYGFNPATRIVAQHLPGEAGQRCQEESRPVSDDGTIPCTMIEASLPHPEQRGSCCAEPGRTPVTDPVLLEAVHDHLEVQGKCEDQGDISCDDYCVCEIPQASGTELLECKQNLDTPRLDGARFCYIDPEQDPDANPELVSDCPSSEQRNFRYIGHNTPKNHSMLFLGCE